MLARAGGRGHGPRRLLADPRAASALGALSCQPRWLRNCRHCHCNTRCPGFKRPGGALEDSRADPEHAGGRARCDSTHLGLPLHPQVGRHPARHSSGPAPRAQHPARGRSLSCSAGQPADRCTRRVALPLGGIARCRAHAPPASPQQVARPRTGTGLRRPSAPTRPVIRATRHAPSNIILPARPIGPLRRATSEARTPNMRRRHLRTRGGPRRPASADTSTCPAGSWCFRRPAVNSAPSRKSAPRPRGAPPAPL